MIDQCILDVFDAHTSHLHPSTCFSDPTETERVIFLPGGKAMVVDWNIESFVKGVVSVTIAGAVVIGAGVYGLMWADQRIKNKQKRGVAPRRPQAKSDSESSSDDSSD